MKTSNNFERKKKQKNETTMKQINMFIQTSAVLCNKY